MNRSAGRARSRLRVGIVSLSAAALVLGVAGPTVAQDAPTGAGTSTISIVPGTLEVDGLPVAVDAALGTLLADATNVENPLARLALTDVGVAGQRAPQLALTSADGPKRGSQERSVGAAGVGATVGLVDYLIESGADRAIADLGGLAAEITTPLGLGTDIGSQGLTAVAEPTQTAGEVVVSLTGLELGLDDLLPADVLDQLPLGVVLDLLDSLGIPLPTDLQQQVDALLELPAALDEILAAGDGLPAGLDDLADLPAVGSALSQLSAARTQLQSAVSAVNGITSQVNALLGVGSVLPAELTALTGQVQGLQSVVTTAEQAVDAAVAQLEAALDAVGLGDLLTLLDGLDGLLGGLDLDDLLSDLLDTLTGLPLLSLGSVDLTLRTVADGAKSLGTVGCSADGLEILGAAVPVSGCDAIGAAIEGLGGTLSGLLAELPLAGALPITVGGLVADSSGEGTPDAEGIATAFARISALDLEIAPVALDGVVDELTSGLLGDLGDLDDLLGLLDGLLADLDLDAVLDTVDGLVTQLTGGLTNLQTLLGRLAVLPGAGGVDLGGVVGGVIGGLGPILGGGGGALPGLGLATAGGAPMANLTLPAGLDALVGEVLGVLQTLPTGIGLDGLRTAGLHAALGQVGVESTFVRSASATPGTPAAPGTPGSPGAPVTPGSLPNTGLELHTLLMAALAALAAGGVTASLGRPATMQLLRSSIGTPRAGR